MQVKKPHDLWAGLMFTVAGLSFALGATSYSFGQSARPGPGYFPFGLGVLLAVLGGALLVKAFVGAREHDPELDHPIAWRPLLVVVASIVLFGLALPHLGMVIALPLLITTISAAGDDFRWRDVLLSSVVLTAGCWAVFIEGLSLTLPLWPSFVR